MGPGPRRPSCRVATLPIPEEVLSTADKGPPDSRTGKADIVESTRGMSEVLVEARGGSIGRL